MAEVVENSGEVGGASAHWRRAGDEPVLFVHGVPTASWDWGAHLERIGGVAPDLPGFGRSRIPDGFDCTMHSYAGWLREFVETAGLDRFALVVHDWGGLALIMAQEMPERIERLVIHTTVPLLPGYRWHWIARMWRRRGIGELFMATNSKAATRRLLSLANVSPGSMPDWFVDSVWDGFDAETKRAILGLYRSADPDRLEAAGSRLGELRCPALVMWPSRDPYIGAEFGPRYAAALGGEVRLETYEDAGHWSWIDRPDMIETAAEFLGAGR